MICRAGAAPAGTMQTEKRNDSFFFSFAAKCGILEPEIPQGGCKNGISCRNRPGRYQCGGRRGKRQYGDRSTGDGKNKTAADAGRCDLRYRLLCQRGSKKSRDHPAGLHQRRDRRAGLLSGPAGDGGLCQQPGLEKRPAVRGAAAGAGRAGAAFQ